MNDIWLHFSLITSTSFLKCLWAFMGKNFVENCLIMTRKTCEGVISNGIFLLDYKGFLDGSNTIRYIEILDSRKKAILKQHHIVHKLFELFFMWSLETDSVHFYYIVLAFSSLKVFGSNSYLFTSRQSYDNQQKKTRITSSFNYLISRNLSNARTFPPHSNL